MIPFEPLWAHYKRVIKKNGAIVLTGSQPFTSALVMSNVEWFKHEWIWRKPRGTGYLNANRQPMKNHENVIVFSQAAHVYNPQKSRGAAYRATSGSVGDFVRDKTVGGYETVNDGSRFPLTVIDENSETGIHPTQKPVPLMAYLIATYTNKGETVLDNCMGSGTTGVACVQTGRNFIGIEKDDKYFEIARKRIEGDAAQECLAL